MSYWGGNAWNLKCLCSLDIWDAVISIRKQPRNCKANWQLLMFKVLPLCVHQNTGFKESVQPVGNKQQQLEGPKCFIIQFDPVITSLLLTRLNNWITPLLMESTSGELVLYSPSAGLVSSLHESNNVECNCPPVFNIQGLCSVCLLVQAHMSPTTRL